MDLISELIYSFIDLVWNGALVGILILIVMVVLLFIFNKVQKHLKTKWLQGTFVTLFLSFFIFFLVIHAINISAGAQGVSLTALDTNALNNPSFVASQPTPAGLFLNAIIKSIITAGIFSLLVLPFAFLGVALFDGLKKRVSGVWPRFVLVSFLAGILFILLLAAFPWILVSLIYLSFYGI